MRAGSAIPTGGAEGVLAFLYEQNQKAWPFLTERLMAVDPGDTQEEVSPKNGNAPAEGLEEREGGADTEGEAAVTSRPGETDGKNQSNENGIGQQEKPKGRDQDDEKRVKRESYSLARMSAALEEFAHACSDRGCVPEGLAVQDLVNFLYLGGQAKVRFRCIPYCAVEAPLAEPYCAVEAQLAESLNCQFLNRYCVGRDGIPRMVKIGVRIPLNLRDLVTWKLLLVLMMSGGWVFRRFASVE